MAGHEERDLPRVEAARQGATHVEEAAEVRSERLAAAQEAGRLHRGRGVVGQDREESEVVGRELAQAELAEGDDPDRPLVVTHRDDQHRLVDLVGPGDRLPAWVTVRVVDPERHAMLGHPAGEALAEAAAEDVGIHDVVLPHPTLEGDRHDLVALQHVDPGVVVFDDPADLLDDGPSDGLDVRGPVHPRRRRPEDLQVSALLADPPGRDPGRQDHQAGDGERQGPGPLRVVARQRRDGPGTDAEAGQPRADEDPGVDHPAHGPRRARRAELGPDAVQPSVDGHLRSPLGDRAFGLRAHEGMVLVAVLPRAHPRVRVRWPVGTAGGGSMADPPALRSASDRRAPSKDIRRVGARLSPGRRGAVEPQGCSRREADRFGAHVRLRPQAHPRRGHGGTSDPDPRR